VVAQCVSHGRHTPAGGEVFALDGSSVTLMPLALPKGYRSGQDAWPLAGATLFAIDGPCGPDALIFGPGNAMTLHIPNPRGAVGTAVPRDGYNNTVLAVTSGSRQCKGGGPQSLISYDIRTRRSVALLGPGMNGGNVLSVVPFS
jgi:hypothetical protein